jgi:uncharacterized protein YgiM (DUF1202 family)
MAAYYKFLPAIENLFENINSGADAWVIKLATAVDDAAGTITETANGGGYTTGGNAASTTSAGRTGGTFKLVLASPTVWLASAGGFTFRYAVLVDSTTSTNVAYWDYGTSQTVASGETVTVVLDASNGVFQAT